MLGVVGTCGIGGYWSVMLCVQVGNECWVVV